MPAGVERVDHPSANDAGSSLPSTSSPCGQAHPASTSLKLALRRVVASSCRNALVQHTPAMNSLPPLAPSFGKQDPTPMPHVNKRQARVLRIRRPAGRTRRASAPSSPALLPPVQPPHAPRLHFAGPGDLLEWGSAGGYADDEGREGHEGFDDDLGVGRGNG